MIRHIASAIVAASFLFLPPQSAVFAVQPDAVRLAADKQSPVQAAISREFAGYKVEETGTKQFNGITVTYLKISNNSASAAGAVTQNGDFIIAGMPHDANKLPGPVDELIKELFNTRPNNVTSYVVTTYLINIENNGHPASVTLDAVGRLKQVTPILSKPIGQNAEPDILKEGDETTKRMRSMAERFFGKGSKVEHIFRDTDVEHFYHVALVGSNGRQISAVTNGNDLYSVREKIGERQIPAAVIDSVQQIFKGAKITATFRRTYNYYQFEEKTSGGDTLTMKIGVNGEILGIASEQAQLENQQIKSGN